MIFIRRYLPILLILNDFNSYHVYLMLPYESHPVCVFYSMLYTLNVEFKGIEEVLWRKQRIASETGFPLKLAVCAVSQLLSSAVAEKQPSKRHICIVRNEDYITVQDATTSPYQKPRSTGCDAANQPVQKWHASNNGIYSLSTPSIFFYLYDIESLCSEEG